MALPNATHELEDVQEDGHYEPDGDEDGSDDDSYPIDHYDLVSTPNDFNTTTLVNFIDSGVVTIPGFQRNFVWDLKRASRLIESLIVGLPVPQVFLYEQGGNSYLVIDGQQRLMSIYYFVRKRFPRKEKLAEIRAETEGQSTIPDKLLKDNKYFRDFRLHLPEVVPGTPNIFNGCDHSTLDDDVRRKFDIRTIRHVIVRQVGPKGDTAMYEIFNRLNSGGINLRPQEIRRCTFDSKFYDILYKTNAHRKWRTLVGTDIPDLHMKDVEILLRGFAMLINGENYHPSMTKFLNKFSQDAKSFDQDKLEQCESLLDSFLVSCSGLRKDSFHSIQSRFSPMIFESVFVAACREPYDRRQEVKGTISRASLNELKKDPAFQEATQHQTTSRQNVMTRLERAREILALN